MNLERLGLVLALIHGCSGARQSGNGSASANSAGTTHTGAIDAGTHEATSSTTIPPPAAQTRPSPCGALLDGRVCEIAGVAQFGRTSSEARFDERPARAARLRAFILDADEVSAAAYAACVVAGACRAPACDDAAPLPEQGAARCIAWEDARAFCVRAGGRLPSEAEWERAAAGLLPVHRTFPWGEDPAAGGDAGIGALDITPEGVRSLGGGVAEWVDDAGAFYLLPAPRPDAGTVPTDGSVADAGAVHPAPLDTSEREGPDAGVDTSDSGLVTVDDPHGPHDGAWRVVRGGFDEAPIADWTSSRRRFRQPVDRRHWIGFRCAYDATAP